MSIPYFVGTFAPGTIPHQILELIKEGKNRNPPKLAVLPSTLHLDHVLLH
jgi:hypothetical protein